MKIVGCDQAYASCSGASFERSALPPRPSERSIDKKPLRLSIALHSCAAVGQRKDAGRLIRSRRHLHYVGEETG